MTTERPVTVVLVDDHEVVRRGIRAYFASQADLEVVGEAASGSEALTVVAEQRPDVVVMDLRLSGIDGIETTRAVRDLAPGTRVVVLTSYGADDFLYPALRAGALGYLLKDVGADELATAVRRAACGEPTLSPSIAARLMQEVASAGSDEPGPDPLTPRETEVLAQIAEGLSNLEIARQLNIAETTVKAHVSHVLAKLAVDDRTQAAVYAWRSGLVGRESDP